MTDSAVQAIPDADATDFDPDVIVVGSGSAGAAAARRLVDRGARVLLLEAGGPDVNPAIHDPGRAARAVAERGGLGLRDRAAAPRRPIAGSAGRAGACSAARAA